MTQESRPLFSLFDNVAVCGGGRGTVVEIRRYANTGCAYTVNGLIFDDVEVNGIYDEGNLQPLGTVADPEIFKMEGPYGSRDIVRFKDELRGTEGYVAGDLIVVGPYDTTADGTTLVGVVTDDDSEDPYDVDVGKLQPTGRRYRVPLGRAQSLAVSPDGTILGTHDYELIASIEAL